MNGKTLFFIAPIYNNQEGKVIFGSAIVIRHKP